SPGTLEHWLTERYCLYARSPAGKLLRNDVHHVPWPLQHAEAKIEKNTMLTSTGISLPDTTPILHFARQWTSSSGAQTKSFRGLPNMASCEFIIASVGI